jgi:hypothetical protein
LAVLHGGGILFRFQDIDDRTGFALNIEVQPAGGNGVPTRDSIAVSPVVGGRPAPRSGNGATAILS